MKRTLFPATGFFVGSGMFPVSVGEGVVTPGTVVASGAVTASIGEGSAVTTGTAVGAGVVTAPSLLHPPIIIITSKIRKTEIKPTLIFPSPF